MSLINLIGLIDLQCQIGANKKEGVKPSFLVHEGEIGVLGFDRPAYNKGWASVPLQAPWWKSALQSLAMSLSTFCN